VLGLISAIVAVIAALAAAAQLLIMQRLSQQEISSGSMLDFWSAENRALRAIVWNLEGKPYSEWLPEERHAADQVATQLSLLGMLIKQHNMSREAFLNFYGTWCVRAFLILTPLVKEKRAEYQSPDQWIYFEWLARVAERQLQKRPWWRSRSWTRLKSRTPALPDLSAASPNPDAPAAVSPQPEAS
jgi:hypothetical protein